MPRFIAFYLPQFYPIKENDEWWGSGFTEWTNVTRASPKFSGHHQPRLPKDLGFYDTRVPETRNAQFEMAASYGVDAFCYYYYWFNGRRLLSRPLDDVLEGVVDPFPFCICWANENWTRRWDGMENEILVEQKHNLASDIEFIRDVIPVLSNTNYLTVEGLPILLVYRVDRLENASETAAAWRREALLAGLPGLHLCAVQSFGFNDPTQHGFDSAVEFPPHFLGHYGERPQADLSSVSGLDNEFSGNIYNYEDVVRHAESRPKENYKLYRGVMCAWDNTARRGSTATIFYKASPSWYERWLTAVTKQASRTELAQGTEELVFINAWNEWAEGSVLEPCTTYDEAFLIATQRAKKSGIAQAHLPDNVADNVALLDEDASKREAILIVGHDAARNGAQLNLLAFAKVLKSRAVPTTALLLGGGALVSDYRRVCSTIIAPKDLASSERCEALLDELRRRGYRRAITNTAATGSMVWALKRAGFTVVSLLHELPTVIDQMSLRDQLGAIASYSDKVVFASNFVRNALEKFVLFPDERTVIRPQGCYNLLTDADRKIVKYQPRLYWERMSIPDDDRIVVSVGYGDWRKGIDLFCLLAQQYYTIDPHVHFVWVGDIDYHMKGNITAQISNGLWRGNLHLMAFSDEIGKIILSADLFVLMSREDPFPTVILEALDAGKPVVAFRGAGGFIDLEETGLVTLVQYLNLREMQDAVFARLQDSEYRRKVEIEAPALIAEEYSYVDYVEQVCWLAQPHPVYADRPRAKLSLQSASTLYNISVVVPSYNAAPFITKRLASIHYQSLPPREVIVLDDKSTDGSDKIIRDYISEENLDWHFSTSAENSGSPFVQWARGIALCRGELVWIAESDDFSSLDFLEKIAFAFDDPSVALAYCQSKPVGQHDESLNFSYEEYLAEVDPDLWRRSFKMDGRYFAENYLSSLNTIPNASAVVFRRTAAQPILDEIVKYNVCGDWVFYSALAEMGKVAFVPQTMNFHRRHSSSVVSQSEKDQRYIRELLMVGSWMLEDRSSSPTLLKRAALLQRIRNEYERHRKSDMPSAISDHEEFGLIYRKLVSSLV